MQIQMRIQPAERTVKHGCFPYPSTFWYLFRPLARRAQRRETLKRAVMAGKIPQAGFIFHHKTVKV
jgi:hypothetical protein